MNNQEILTRVKNMRSQIKESDAYVCRFDETNVDSFNNYLIWDDVNLLLYCISSNTELQSQAIFPFKIKAFHYGKLEFISRVYSPNNLK